MGTTVERAAERGPSLLPALNLRFTKLDRALKAAMAKSGLPAARIALGIVFFWFGVLKFFPGLSPAQDLATRTIGVLTFGLLQPAVSIKILALWECVIGLGLLSGKYLRATLLLLFLQMAGTMLPILFFPQETFTWFPIAPTLEGQYIIKNLVLVAVGLILGATVDGAEIREENAPSKTTETV